MIQHFSRVVGIFFLFSMTAIGQVSKCQTLLETWHDAGRGRDVPVKIYLPEMVAKGERFPLIVFSHGLGGSRENYQFLGEHWAQNGFISVHVQHLGSDDAVWKELAMGQRLKALKQAASYQQSLARFADISFALDTLETHGRLKDKIDFKKIGVAGHSYGAHTVLAISGQIFPMPGGKQRSFVDQRVKASIVMSPQAPKNNSSAGFVFSKISLPMLHLTGTLDGSPIDSSVSPKSRQIPFQNIKGPAQYLIVFNNGDHMIFSGRERSARDRTDISKEQLAVFHEHIKTASLAFWKAWLDDDGDSRVWLKSNDGLKLVLGGSATFLFK